MKHLKKAALIIGVVTASGILFQNCGKTNFQSSPQASDSSSGSSSQASSNGSGGTPMTGAAAGASDIDFTQPGNVPVSCGMGMICFAGKTITYRNDSNNIVVASVTGYNASGFTAYFQTPSGRIAYFNFTVSGGHLIASTTAPWRPQFCYNHSPNYNACALVNTPNGSQEFNCGSALYWSGSYTGNSAAQATVCQ